MKTDAPSPEHRVARSPAAERRWAGVVGLVFLCSCGQAPKPPSNEAERVMKNESLLEVRHVSVSIDRPPDVVYQFAATPENMPRWAIGLGTSFRPRGDGSWMAEGGPVGSATVRFVERNRLGVLDHDVTVETGETVHNPVRVVPNGRGSEVVFTLFRRTGVSADQFAQDAKAVEKDLRTLKRLLEGR
jgi:polyketide cyclase/dehydrase/lipid transport protein